MANNNTLPISRGFVNVALGAEKEQPISKNLNAEEVHKNGVQTASFHKLWTERDHVKILFLHKNKFHTFLLHFVFHGGMHAIPSRLYTFLKYSRHALNEHRLCTPAGSPSNWQSCRPVCPPEPLVSHRKCSKIKVANSWQVISRTKKKEK